ncbi:MAG TPA: hypothetical protein VFV38_45920 [Ktedonobacteraceae bacterium]|nr:hypothetical protein [Ktedonobacteraceae bacterium]
MNAAKTGTWRDLLRNLCGENQHKKQEIAERIGFVSVRTIDRWISGQSQPQKQEFIRKLATLSDEMREMLQEEFPEAFASLPKHVLPIERINLPVEFSRRVLHAYAHTPLTSRMWTIFHLVSNQMIPHLDSERSGLMIVHARSVDVSDTIQFGEGTGNGAWTTRQVVAETCAERWLVQAVRSARPFFLQSVETPQAILSCFARHDLIQSVGFFPLYRAGMIGGGVLFLSASADFFTPLRQMLIEEYSYLLALAFSDRDFC